MPTGLNQAYSYDSFGNLLQNGSFNTSYTAYNQMFGYAYDAAGNLLSNGLTTMTWDAENRLTSAGGATYVYDAEGNRVEKQGVGVTDTIYFGGHPIARYSAGGWTDLIYGPSGLLAEVPGTENAEPIYRLTDHLGTEVGTVGSNALFTNPLDHTPFGQAFSGSTNNFYKFTGLEHDSESNLDHAQFRQYSSTMGRWLSPDPYNGSYDLSNPQSFNRYAYVGNSPLSSVDPLGLTPCGYGGCTTPPCGSVLCTSITVTADPFPPIDGLDPIYGFGYSGPTGYSGGRSGGGGRGGGNGNGQHVVKGNGNNRATAPNSGCSTTARVVQGALGIANLADAGVRALGLPTVVGALSGAPPVAAVAGVYGVTSIFGQGLSGSAQLIGAIRGSNSGAVGQAQQVGNILAGPASGFGTIIAGGSTAAAERNANIESLYFGGVGLVNKAAPLVLRLTEAALGTAGVSNVGCH
ncbi:MAG: RHS repeat-associated core domain-containing protein [Edaphobacter sp.]